MRYITSADAVPKLEGLDPYVLANSTLNAAIGRGSRDTAANALAKTYVRIAVQAVDEYEAARLALVDYCSPSSTGLRLIPIIRAASHFESCLSTLHRAIRLLQAAVVRVPGFSVPSLAVLDASTIKRLNRIRNFIQHTDKKIVQGAILDGEPVAVVP